MVVRSNITGKIYDPDKARYVANTPQIVFYNSNGADTEVLDVIYNHRTSKFIFVYPKNGFMQMLYERWIEKLNDENGKEGEAVSDRTAVDCSAEISGNTDEV